MQLSFGNFCLIDYEVTPHSQGLVLVIKYRAQIIQHHNRGPSCQGSDQRYQLHGDSWCSSGGCCCYVVNSDAILWISSCCCEEFTVPNRSCSWRLQEESYLTRFALIRYFIALSIAIIYSLLMLHLWFVMRRPLSSCEQHATTGLQTLPVAVTDHTHDRLWRPEQ